MTSKQKILLAGLIILDLILLIISLGQVFHFIPHLGNFQVLNPKGAMAAGEKQTIITAVLIMLIPITIVLAAAFFVLYNFRIQRKKQYDPDWGNRHSYLQIFGWAFILFFVIILSVINFKTAHSLDPLKPFSSSNPPITIQVVALQWKWLFIYPDQNIATVNYIEVPVNTPIHFELTADAPMNSFWIPQLGGQMYAMAGMVNPLNLIANSTGKFQGSAAEISGQGFAGMKFTVNSVNRDDFNKWVASTKKTPKSLTDEVYHELAEPTENNSEAEYSSVDNNLYNNIIGKYMGNPSVHIHH